MSIKKEGVYSWNVTFDEGDRPGIDYLRTDLQRSESEVFFEQARSKGVVNFEDDQDRDWSLIYNSGDGSFTLLRRQSED